MNIDFQKLLDEAQIEIAEQHGWKKLVTGHKKLYFDEAAKLAMERLIELVANKK